jgi:hypothetical protein
MSSATKKTTHHAAERARYSRKCQEPPASEVLKQTAIFPTPLITICGKGTSNKVPGESLARCCQFVRCFSSKPKGIEYVLSRRGRSNSEVFLGLTNPREQLPVFFVNALKGS